MEFITEAKILGVPFDKVAKDAINYDLLWNTLPDKKTDGTVLQIYQLSSSLSDLEPCLVDLSSLPLVIGFLVHGFLYYSFSLK